MYVHGKKSIARKCCSKPSFFWCCCLTRCLESLSSTRRSWDGLGNGTRDMACDTAQTERILDKTCDRSTPLESRPYQAMRMKTTWRTIHKLTPFHLVCFCRHVSDVQSPLLLSPHFVHGSGATVASQRSTAVRINPSMTHRDVRSIL